MIINMIISGILGAVMGAGFDGVKKLNEKSADKHLDQIRNAPDVFSKSYFEMHGLGDEYDECLARFNKKQAAKEAARAEKKAAKAEAKRLKKAGAS